MVELNKHMGIDMLTTLTNDYPNCTFVVSHLEDSTKAELKKLKIKNVIIPDDGLIIKI